MNTKKLIQLCWLVLLPTSVFADAKILSWSEATPQNLGLGSTTVIELNLKASNDFRDQDVALTVDRSTLEAMDADQDVAVEIEPKTVQLAPGGTATVKVKLSTKTTVASFSGGKISLLAQSKNLAEPARAVVPVSVLPILVIRVSAGEKPNQGPMTWDRPILVELRKHTPNVTIKFINDDVNGPQVIHGGGGIPHQDTAQELPANDGKTPEDKRTYTVVITKQEPLTGYYYSHTYQDTDVRHNVKFNVK